MNKISTMSLMRISMPSLHGDIVFREDGSSFSLESDSERAIFQAVFDIGDPRHISMAICSDFTVFCQRTLEMAFAYFSESDGSPSSLSTGRFSKEIRRPVEIRSEYDSLKESVRRLYMGFSDLLLQGASRAFWIAFGQDHLAIRAANFFNQPVIVVGRPVYAASYAVLERLSPGKWIGLTFRGKPDYLIGCYAPERMPDFIFAFTGSGRSIPVSSMDQLMNAL